jgi:hypothetical protein
VLGELSVSTAARSGLHRADGRATVASQLDKGGQDMVGAARPTETEGKSARGKGTHLRAGVWAAAAASV